MKKRHIARKEIIVLGRPSRSTKPSRPSEDLLPSNEFVYATAHWELLNVISPHCWEVEQHQNGAQMPCMTANETSVAKLMIRKTKCTVCDAEMKLGRFLSEGYLMLRRGNRHQLHNTEKRQLKISRF
ncbi:hypothetical protein AVEN_28854-1 [Araneus ventricosus]|uniref:Uncharacterized protein n=1 Tax=Araneus ventricosus TaxID=182803 RepID=A0A4Y2FIK6_ARAVE|nr:hypothetical protein AVEN_28854-1 [Araneus ventricosus]